MSRACIWDADTMLQERFRAHDMAKLILNGPPPVPAPAPLRQRIESLKAAPKKDNPEWWNNLAGAYIRLGDTKTAIDLLEPLTNRFEKDYGIHANLGTAYHLAGRYADAEREIARDLEINPDAHFGLEKYHLALLQYLVRNAPYKETHVYVDEWSKGFMRDPGAIRFRRADKKLEAETTVGPDPELIEELERSWKGDTNSWKAKAISALKSQDCSPPPYRYKWDLARDEKFRDGVMYMAALNPKEPACFVMLGIACIQERNYNLGVAAYKRAIELHSLQSDQLREAMPRLEDYIWESHKIRFSILGILSLIPLVILIYIIQKLRKWRKRVVATR